MNPLDKHLEMLVSDPTDTTSATIIATTVILAIISFIGVVGNGLVLWAFRCQVLQCVISSLLIFLLACMDMTICLIGIPATLYLDVWQGEATEFLCRAHFAFKGFIVPVSACLLVLIAIERFLLICFIPGITMKRVHLGLAFASILALGITLAIPMSLHVHAVQVVKAHDVLFQPEPLSDGRHDSVPVTLPKDVRVPVRCAKDDAYISDTAYWYYQIVVSTLFSGLFLATALLYVTIFLFVWRHESLMFERYGKSKYRGYCIRIHASVKSVKMSATNAKNVRRAETPKGNEKKEDYALATCASTKNIQFTNPTAACEVGTCSGSNSMECACHCSSTSGVGERTTHSSGSEYPHTMTANPSKQSNLTGVYLGETEAAEEQQQQKKQKQRSQNGKLCCMCKKYFHSGAQQNEFLLLSNQFGAEQLTGRTQSHQDPPPSMTSEFQKHSATAVRSMERRRKPHVYTAKNFAMIAAAFILSYTPYLVYTAMPVSKRSLMPITETGLWSSIGQVLFYLYFANSAANPIIYSCMNRHFRSFLAKQFCTRRLVASSCVERNSRATVASASYEAPKPLEAIFKPADTSIDAN